MRVGWRGRLDEVCAAAGLTIQDDDEIEALVGFADTDTAVRAFTAAGPTQLAIAQSGEPAVAQAVRDALHQFTGPKRQVLLPGWFRIVTPDEAKAERGDDLHRPKPHVADGRAVPGTSSRH